MRCPALRLNGVPPEPLAQPSSIGVHLDRKATLPNAERIAAEVRRRGREALFFNVNAADPDRRAEVLEAVQRSLDERGEPPGRVRVLLHSLAFGTLKPYIADTDAIMSSAVMPAVLSGS